MIRVKVKEYQNYAAKCLELAEQTDDLANKMLLLHMAQIWQRLWDEQKKQLSSIVEKQHAEHHFRSMSTDRGAV